MALGDYILCCKCECKLFYDGYRDLRDRWEDLFGEQPKIECPDCKTQQQEPVAWRYNGKLHEFDPSDWATGPVTPLYTSPPAKPWVGLTDEEISKTFETKVWDARRSYARAIEAKLKEKNQ